VDFGAGKGCAHLNNCRGRINSIDLCCDEFHFYVCFDLLMLHVICHFRLQILGFSCCPFTWS